MSVSLSSLLAAVRAHAPLSVWASALSDADLSEIVRTARTTKGAVWLATRACPAESLAGADTKAEGQADTAIRCLRKLAILGDARATAALAAWDAAQVVADAALAADLADELANAPE